MALPTTQNATLRTLTRPKVNFFTSHQRPSTSAGPLKASATRLFRRSYTNSRPLRSSRSKIMTITWIIIGINTAIFSAWQYAKTNRDQNLLHSLYKHTLISPDHLAAKLYHTTLTSAFTHESLGHFAFNMINLHTFATLLSIHPGLRTANFLYLTFGSAAAASLSWLYHTAQNYRRPVGSGGRKTACGASGIIMGLAAAGTCLAPHAPMTLFFIPVPVPLYVITAAYFFLDTYLLNAEGSRVGHAAHLGGGAFGVLFYFARLRGLGGVWSLIRRRLR